MILLWVLLALYCGLCWVFFIAGAEMLADQMGWWTIPAIIFAPIVMTIEIIVLLLLGVWEFFKNLLPEKGGS